MYICIHIYIYMHKCIYYTHANILGRTPGADQRGRRGAQGIGISREHDRNCKGKQHQE